MNMDIIESKEVELIEQKVVNKLAPLIKSQLDFQARNIENSIRTVVSNGLDDISQKIMSTDTKVCFEYTRYIDKQLLNLGCKANRKRHGREVIKTNLFAIIGIEKYESLTVDKMSELCLTYGKPAKEVLCSLINECIGEFKKNHSEFFYF